MTNLVTSARRHLLRALAVGLTASLAMLLLPAAPSQAAYTYLCKGYDSCNNAGRPHYGYKSSKGTAYWAMVAGNNCTNYVAARFVTRKHDKMSNSRPWSGDGNAYSWGTRNASKTNQTPAVGAVAWWAANKAPAVGYGHVAYVERVVSSSEIWVSESNYGAPANGLAEFGWVKVTKSGAGWPSGFIHLSDERVLATASPSISGTARVGVKLTANKGTWQSSSGVAPRSTVTYKYQWLAAGSNISGATSSTFTPKATHAGKKISVKVTASSTGYKTGTKTSGSTAAVAKGTLSTSTAPSVAGTAQVGMLLTANKGTWSPTPSGFKYQWLADGAVISGATTTTFTPKATHAGKKIAVKVTASLGGYNDLAKTSAARAIANGKMTNQAVPEVTGSPRVGAPLTAGTGTWTPAPSTTGYQWLASGAPIDGAVASSYTPTAQDVGKALSVRVTAQAPGYDPATVTSAATAAVAAAPVPAKSTALVLRSKPTVNGKTRVGRKLKAKAGSWSPTPTRVTYQWQVKKRGFKNIKGGNRATLKIAPKLRGKKLRLRVTVTAPGHRATTHIVTLKGKVRR